MALAQQPTFPLINDFHPTGESHEITWGDLGRFEWTKIEIPIELKSERVFGKGRQGLGEALGRGNVTLKVTMPQLEAERLVSALGSYPMLKRYTVEVTGKEGDIFDVHYTLEAVRLTTLPVAAEGGKATDYAFDCYVERAQRNGQPLY